MTHPVVESIDDAAAAVRSSHTLSTPSPTLSVSGFAAASSKPMTNDTHPDTGVRKNSNKIAEAPPVDRRRGRADHSAGPPGNNRDKPDHSAGVVESGGPYLSREPSDYRATDHFIAQKNHREPKPSSSIIRRVFDDGAIERGNKPGTFTFTEEIRGLRWVIPVAVPGDPPLDDHSGYALSIFALGRSGAGAL